MIMIFSRLTRVDVDGGGVDEPVEDDLQQRVEQTDVCAHVQNCTVHGVIRAGFLWKFAIHGFIVFIIHVSL